MNLVFQLARTAGARGVLAGEYPVPAGGWRVRSVSLSIAQRAVDTSSLVWRVNGADTGSPLRVPAGAMSFDAAVDWTAAEGDRIGLHWVSGSTDVARNAGYISVTLDVVPVPVPWVAGPDRGEIREYVAGSGWRTWGSWDGASGRVTQTVPASDWSVVPLASGGGGRWIVSRLGAPLVQVLDDAGVKYLTAYGFSTDAAGSGVTRMAWYTRALERMAEVTADGVLHAAGFREAAVPVTGWRVGDGTVIRGAWSEGGWTGAGLREL